MLTRFVRIQLAIFTIASIVGILAMVLIYIQAPTLLGIGRMTVTLELPAAGGLYRFSNVTYRGVEVGKVTSVELTNDGAKAIMSLDSSAKIPADLKAEVRSISAIGEQYVDLRPRTNSAPYLRNGSVIAARDATIPQAVGPMLDQLSSLVGSIPKDRLSALLDETFKAFNGAGQDLGSLADTSSELSRDLNRVGDSNAALFTDTAPFLDSQADTTDSIRLWARSLAGVTQQLVTDDPQFRTVLRNAPGAFDEASALLDQLKPTLPVLLANLVSLGQVLVTYHPGIEQLLVLLPPSVAGIQAVSPSRNPTGFALGDFAITSNDPVPCTVGFLPPSAWRSPADTSTIDTPDDLYCKLPQDSPILVRGARNTPCMNKPGKRAPSVEICESDEPYRPLAMRQHSLGPTPFDPNLVGQNWAVDDKVTFPNNIYAPIGGTPLAPPGYALSEPGAPAPASAPIASSAATSPGAEQNTPLPDSAVSQGEQPHGPSPGPVPASDPGSVVPQAATSSSGAAAPIATAQYDPRTGRYLAPDGQLYQQGDLAPASAPQSWQDMLPK